MDALRSEDLHPTCCTGTSTVFFLRAIHLPTTTQAPKVSLRLSNSRDGGCGGAKSSLPQANSTASSGSTLTSGAQAEAFSLSKGSSSSKVFAEHPPSSCDSPPCFGLCINPLPARAWQLHLALLLHSRFRAVVDWATEPQNGSWVAVALMPSCRCIPGGLVAP